MSLIEQANRRLEELRRAGIDVPAVPSAQPDLRGQAPVIARGPQGPLERPGVAAPAVVRHEGEPVPAPQPQVLTQSQLVHIDLVRLAAEGYLTPDDPRMVLTEEMRAVKRPIINWARESKAAGRMRGNLILVTSAMAGEGKTFCSINLAMSIAMEVDHSVLLVDADVVRPSVMGRLGLEGSQGLLDVLGNPSLDLSDVLLRTNVPKLSVLPAGNLTDKSTEFLASEAMERLLAEVAERYSDRIVIFDGPPILATSESRVLAARMGQVVVVVESQKTSQAAVTRALADVAACETVWCVLNKASAGHATSGYERYAPARRD
jgi:receptor protein-tyrosine kinase